ncbi:MAG: hypothetical protein HC929_23955 [Leptolyngbyaceae cyanobacterium SM2_5_2]|nr:hypothetical protein [Leptolyngbyaceae cyanobacterium SM2_5_2]
MHGRVILLTLLAPSGCGLGPWALRGQGDPPALAQSETAETIASLPWQFFSSTPGRYIVDLPGMATEQTSTSTLLDRELVWHMSAVTVPAIDKTDLFEYYLVADLDIPQ